MIKIQVAAIDPYEVVIACDWRERLLALSMDRTRIAIVHSAAMAPLVRLEGDIDAEIFYFGVADGEDGKSLASLSTLWNWLAASQFTRSDLIVGIGGGTVTDVAGFAAASWLRGIDWIAIPTTLAGMVDAAVGGKTGINSEYGKNLIGAFHSPIAVLVDTSWLLTLTDRDFSAGMAEVIKCGFIKDAAILEIVAGRSLSSIRDDLPATLCLIERAVKVKAEVVGVDFKEGFAREILNYGHTLGHAVEIHSKYSLRHGEAVAIGMVYAAELAQITGHLASDVVEMHRSILSNLNLPISYRRGSWLELLATMALDKKARGKSMRFVGISAIGQTLRIENVLERELAEAYERVSI